MALLSELKAADVDRYMRGLWRPEAAQAAFLTYAAFAAEVTRIPQSVKEPQLGLIKLAWWREVLEEQRSGKPPRPHPVLQVLAALPHIDWDGLGALITQAEQELEVPAPQTIEALLEQAKQQAQRVENLLAGAEVPEGRARAIGIVYYLKRIFPLARSGISPFPAAEVNPDQMGSVAYKQAAITFTKALVETAWAEAGPVERFYLRRARRQGYNLLQQDIRENLGLSYHFALLSAKINKML